MSAHHIAIERDLCSGFGACVDIDSESYTLASDGIAVALVEVTDRDAALAAAQACPMGAIRVVDDDGRKIV